MLDTARHFLLEPDFQSVLVYAALVAAAIVIAMISGRAIWCSRPSPQPSLRQARETLFKTLEARLAKRPKSEPEAARAGLGLLGRPRTASSLALAELVHPLMASSIDERMPMQATDSPEPSCSNPYVSPSIAAPWSPVTPAHPCSPYSPGGLADEHEGVWRPGTDLRVITSPSPPFVIQEASPGWLRFCGFRASEIKGRTLAVLQGPPCLLPSPCLLLFNRPACCRSLRAAASPARCCLPCPLPFIWSAATTELLVRIPRRPR